VGVFHEINTERMKHMKSAPILSGESGIQSTIPTNQNAKDNGSNTETSCINSSGIAGNGIQRSSIRLLHGEQGSSS